ncbi:hypothetical protein HDU85_000178 [Gaertneriomyces sp. JEL0708]|nr:hypothetical protein HDU85_000178 [Gaertneriomyces sp. JEL0708]
MVDQQESIDHLSEEGNDYRHDSRLCSPSIELPPDIHASLDRLSSTFGSITWDDVHYGFVILQALALQNPAGVDLTFYATSAAVECDDPRARIWNDIKSMWADGTDVIEKAKDGDLDAIGKLLHRAVGDCPAKDASDEKDNVAKPAAKETLCSTKPDLLMHSLSVGEAKDEDNVEVEPGFKVLIRWIVHVTQSHPSSKTSDALPVLETQSLVISRRLIHALCSGSVYSMAAQVLLKAADEKNWLDTLIEEKCVGFRTGLVDTVRDMVTDGASFFESMHVKVLEGFVKAWERRFELNAVERQLRDSFQTFDTPYDVPDALSLWASLCSPSATMTADTDVFTTVASILRKHTQSPIRNWKDVKAKCVELNISSWWRAEELEQVTGETAALIGRLLRGELWEKIFGSSCVDARQDDSISQQPVESKKPKNRTRVKKVRLKEISPVKLPVDVAPDAARAVMRDKPNATDGKALRNKKPKATDTVIGEEARVEGSNITVIEDPVAVTDRGQPRNDDTTGEQPAHVALGADEGISMNRAMALDSPPLKVCASSGHENDSGSNETRGDAGSTAQASRQPQQTCLAKDVALDTLPHTSGLPIRDQAIVGTDATQDEFDAGNENVVAAHQRESSNATHETNDATRLCGAASAQGRPEMLSQRRPRREPARDEASEAKNVAKNTGFTKLKTPRKAEKEKPPASAKSIQQSSKKSELRAPRKPGVPQHSRTQSPRDLGEYVNGDAQEQAGHVSSAITEQVEGGSRRNNKLKSRLGNALAPLKALESDSEHSPKNRLETDNEEQQSSAPRRRKISRPTHETVVSKELTFPEASDYGVRRRKTTKADELTVRSTELKMPTEGSLHREDYCKTSSSNDCDVGSDADISEQAVEAIDLEANTIHLESGWRFDVAEVDLSSTCDEEETDEVKRTPEDEKIAAQRNFDCPDTEAVEEPSFSSAKQAFPIAKPDIQARPGIVPQRGDITPSVPTEETVAPAAEPVPISRKSESWEISFSPPRKRRSQASELTPASDELRIKHSRRRTSLETQEEDFGLDDMPDFTGSSLLPARGIQTHSGVRSAARTPSSDDRRSPHPVCDGISQASSSERHTSTVALPPLPVPRSRQAYRQSSKTDDALAYPRLDSGITNVSSKPPSAKHSRYSEHKSYTHEHHLPAIVGSMNGGRSAGPNARLLSSPPPTSTSTSSFQIFDLDSSGKVQPSHLLQGRTTSGGEKRSEADGWTTEEDAVQDGSNSPDEDAWTTDEENVISVSLQMVRRKIGKKREVLRRIKTPIQSISPAKTPRLTTKHMPTTQTEQCSRRIPDTASNDPAVTRAKEPLTSNQDSPPVPAYGQSPASSSARIAVSHIPRQRKRSDTQRAEPQKEPERVGRLSADNPISSKGATLSSAPQKQSTSDRAAITSPAGKSSGPSRRDSGEQTSVVKSSTPRRIPKPCLKPKSNTLLLLNALHSICLPGKINEETLGAAVKSLKQSHHPHHVILLRSTGNHAFRGLYGVPSLSSSQPIANALRIFPIVETDPVIADRKAKGWTGPPPERLPSEELEAFFKYDSGGRRFVPVWTKGLGVWVDAVCIRK